MYFTDGTGAGWFLSSHSCFTSPLFLFQGEALYCPWQKRRDKCQHWTVLFNKTNLKDTHNDKLEAEAHRVHTVQNEQIWRRNHIQAALTGTTVFFSHAPLQNKACRRHDTYVFPATWACKSGIKECCVTKQQRAIRRINSVLREIEPLDNFAFKREEEYKHHHSCVR